MGFEGASTYIDETLIEGVLAGILLLLLAAWLRFANNWLWRESLSLRGSTFLRCVALLGLNKSPKDRGPRLTANGLVDDQKIALTIEGSYRGRRMVCRIGDLEEHFVSTAPFVEVESALTSWLSCHRKETGEELNPENLQVGA